MKFLPIILLFIISNAYSQIGKVNDSYFLIAGTVVDGINNKALAGAHLTTTKSYSTKTDINGSFSLNVKENDTVSISFIGYKTFYYLVPKNTEKKHLIKFKLYKDSISLKEVEIFPWPSYDDFKKAFEELNFKEQEIKMAGVKMYKDSKVEPYDFKAVHLFTNPLSFIYDKLLDKKAKTRRRIEKRKEIINKSAKKHTLEE